MTASPVEFGRWTLTHDRPRSWLVTPRVSRARAVLLRSFNVDWLPMTAEDFAVQVLGSHCHAGSTPHGATG